VRTCHKSLDTLRRGPAVGTTHEAISSARGMYLLIFLADGVVGAIAPTLPIYAQSVGASVSLLGVIVAASSVALLLTLLPVGAISDDYGRRPVLIGCMASLIAACLVFSSVSSALLLIVPAALFGLAQLAFAVGPAYIADVVPHNERPRAVAAYTTAMGAGLAVGAAIGGWSATQLGYAATYRWCAVVSLFGLVVALRLRAPASSPAMNGANVRPSGNLQRLVRPTRNPGILLASLGNLVFGVTYLAAITTFFPVYLGTLGCDATTIGLLFMVRGIVSTATRVAVGYALAGISTRTIMFAAVGVDAIALVLMGIAPTVPALAFFLALEGMAYGAYVTAGQVDLLSSSSAGQRGTAASLFSLAGVLGGAGGAIVLGEVAQHQGAAQALLLAGAFAGVSILALARLRYGHRTARMDLP